MEPEQDQKSAQATAERPAQAAPAAAPPEESSASKPTKAATSYGKRPMWQWVLLYVVLAIIVYGLIYYFFLRDSGTDGTGGLGY
ncbi:MAG: hypothetical protein WD877_00445 [Candidatus Saccharimonadales bacterium]